MDEIKQCGICNGSGKISKVPLFSDGSSWRILGPDFLQDCVCIGYPLRTPNRPGWQKNPFPAPIPTRHQVWDHPMLGLRVISTIEFTSPSRGVELHLSISEKGGKFPRWVLIEKVRKEFDAAAFEQDDHGSTVAHLWLPIERDKRGECDCK